eukprot:gene7096-14441_t
MFVSRYCQAFAFWHKTSKFTLNFIQSLSMATDNGPKRFQAVGKGRTPLNSASKAVNRFAFNKNQNKATNVENDSEKPVKQEKFQTSSNKDSNRSSGDKNRDQPMRNNGNHVKTEVSVMTTLTTVIDDHITNKTDPSSDQTLLEFTAVLEEGKARLFRDGNPIVYAGAIKHIIGNPQAGDEILVTDHKSNIIARGFFNQHSQYRVRVIALYYEKDLFNLTLTEIIKKRIENAINLRKQIDLPNESTTVYRLINGEGDRLGGLMVDILDGWDETSFEYSNLNSTMTTSNNLVKDSWVVAENNVKYLVNPEDGQKTGFYCDQRDNRLLLRTLSKGKAVLDTSFYTGGFSINAALGGANSVTAIDTSSAAILAASDNAKLNDISPDKISFIEMDAVKFLREAKAQGLSYDIVICDPPKLAPKRTGLDRAIPKYIQINSLAMSLVKPGGLLFTFSCSAAVTQTNSLL